VNKSKSIYILTSSNNVLDDIKESLEPLSYLRVEGISSLDMGLDIINEVPPDILLLGEDLGLDEIARISKEIRKNKKLENIPLVYTANDPDSSKIEILLKKSLADDCFLLRYNIAEKKFRIDRLLELKRLREGIERYKIENLYFQSEIAAHERRRYYLDKKRNKESKEALVNMMHKIRTFLTGIKGGMEILLKNELQDEDRENIKTLISRNFSELEEFINSMDLVKMEEKRSLQPRIAQFKNIFDEVFKRAQFEARKKSISLFLEPLKKNYSVLSDAEALEFGFESILRGLIYSTKSGSIIKGEVRPQNVGNLLEVSIWLSEDSINREEFEKYIEYHPEALEFLSLQKNKIEIFEEQQNTILRFYLPQLS